MKAGPRTGGARSIGWPGALLLLLAGVVSALHVGKASAVLQALQADLGLDIAGASWLVAAPGFLGALLGVPVGLVVDRWGARRLTVVGLLVQAGAAGVGVLIAQPAWLLASRVVEGLGFQVVIVAAPALIARTMQARRRPAAMAAWSTFMPVGLAAAMLAVPLLASQGWRALWWSAVVAALAIALAVRLLLPEPGRAEQADTRWGHDLAALWRARSPVLLAALFGLFNACYFAVFGFLPMLLQGASQAMGAPPGLLAAVAIAASAAGNLAGLAMLARGARATAVLGGAFLALAACSIPIAVDVATGPWARYAASVGFGGVAGLIPAALFAQAPASAPRPGLQGLVIGLMMQGSNVGMVAGAPVAGALVGAFGWPAVAVVVIVLASVALAGVRALRLRPTP